MISKEQEPKGRERIYYKRLDLITPEKANQLGIPAEAPVFVSPQIRTEQVCDICSSSYKPLVYQTGHSTTAHHFHPVEGEGGIYFKETSESLIRLEGGNWFALLEPLDEAHEVTIQITDHVKPISISVFRIAQAVLVQGVIANCRGYENHAILCCQEIKSGFVAPLPKDPNSLIPLCGREKHPYLRNHPPKYSFQITEEGEVLFSPI